MAVVLLRLGNAVEALVDPAPAHSGTRRVGLPLNPEVEERQRLRQAVGPHVTLCKRLEGDETVRVVLGQGRAQGDFIGTGELALLDRQHRPFRAHVCDCPAQIVARRQFFLREVELARAPGRASRQEVSLSATRIEPKALGQLLAGLLEVFAPEGLTGGAQVILELESPHTQVTGADHGQREQKEGPARQSVDEGANPAHGSCHSFPVP